MRQKRQGKYYEIGFVAHVDIHESGRAAGRGTRGNSEFARREQTRNACF